MDVAGPKCNYLLDDAMLIVCLIIQTQAVTIWRFQKWRGSLQALFGHPTRVAVCFLSGCSVAKQPGEGRQFRLWSSTVEFLFAERKDNELKLILPV